MIVDLLSGVIIPISFYPGWLHQLMSYLPFQTIGYLPTVILVKGVTFAVFMETIGIQLVWMLILGGLIHWIWSRARRSLVIQGG